MKRKSLALTICCIFALVGSICCCLGDVSAKSEHTVKADHSCCPKPANNTPTTDEQHICECHSLAEKKQEFVSIRPQKLSTLHHTFAKELPILQHALHAVYAKQIIYLSSIPIYIKHCVYRL